MRRHLGILSAGLAAVVLAACPDEEKQTAVDGVPCDRDNDCLGAFPELRECEVPVCSEAGVCAIGEARDGSECRDGQICTSHDYCLQGNCTGIALDCDDDDPCTEDRCDNKSGCYSIAAEDGLACDDDNGCTLGDACADGLCRSGALTPGCCRFDGDCADDDPCTDDRCTEGACTHPFNFAPCNDGNACTGPDHCDGAGACGGDARLCDDGNACTIDTCNPDSGTCSSGPATDGSPCEDGNPCTVEDTCGAGVCESGPSLCECTTDADCATFEDGDLCNGTLRCASLRCVVDPLTVVACNPTGDTACVKNTCDPETAQCRPVAALNGTFCQDQNPCTDVDQCQNGLCFGVPKSCDDQNPCTFDACSPVTGCANVANNLPCNDGSACTGNDQCQGGQCAGVLIACNDQNPCTADSCDPIAGCRFNPTAGECSDGNACTDGDACAGGQCVPGQNTCQCDVDGDCAAREDGDKCNGTLVCRDHQCVVDQATVVTCNTTGDTTCRKTVCQAATGLCVPSFTADGVGCSDGSACTAQDECLAGLCVGSAVDCDDGNLCTTDACDPASGCRNTQNTLACDDGNRCTGNDKCGGGLCSGVNVTCDDGNPCTVDACNPASGCAVSNAPDNTACNDAEPCTSGDRCVAGACTGNAVTCNDNNPCTSDACVPGVGCRFTNLPDNSACTDGSACTGGDRCVTGACSGTPIACNDNNPCTTDGCNPASGCTTTQATNGATCSDGDPCTSPDTCQAGSCTGGAFVCGCLTTADCADEEDGDLCNGTLFCDTDGQCKVNPATVKTCADPGPCQDAVCQPATGLCQTVNANNGGACNDQNGCTTNDACSSGVCSGVTTPCNDNNPCTADSCSNGACRFVAAFDGQSCASDNNPCTLDVCQAGQCANLEVLDGTSCADDGNTCTADQCVDGQCAHPARADGYPCADDGFECTYDQCESGTCVHVSNDPAPVSSGECFPVKQITANTGTITDGWSDCGTADQFPFGSGRTGAIDEWSCADPNFYYDGVNTGYEYAYVFVAPLDGICTFIEYNEGVKVQGSLVPFIDWFLLDGSGPCEASQCLEYVYENSNAAICGSGNSTCSFRDFAVTQGQIFYLVADIYAGSTSQGRQTFPFNSTWTIEIECREGTTLLLNEDFNDAVCNGCSAQSTAGASCTNFGWHPIGGFSPSNQVTIGTSYYVGQLQNNTLLGYDCGATSSTLTFPSVTLPSTATSCALTFDLYMDLDAADATDCVNDLLTVKVDPASGPPVNAPGATCASNTTSSNPIGYEATTIKSMSYDLTSWKGAALQVQLAWSADAAANNGLGAIVDNVRVSCETP